MFAHLLLSLSLTLHGHLVIGLSPHNVTAEGTCIHMYLHVYMYIYMYMYVLDYHKYIHVCEHTSEMMIWKVSILRGLGITN